MLITLFNIKQYGCLSQDNRPDWKCFCYRTCTGADVFSNSGWGEQSEPESDKLLLDSIYWWRWQRCNWSNTNRYNKAKRRVMLMLIKHGFSTYIQSKEKVSLQGPGSKWSSKDFILPSKKSLHGSTFHWTLLIKHLLATFYFGYHF